MTQPLPVASSPLVVLVVGCILMACHSPRSQTAAVLPDIACPQTSEFGNTGCFEVRGQVIGAAGQPLAGIFVGPKPAPSPHPVPVPAMFNTVNVPTDSAGQFRVRLMRMFGDAPAGGEPDTLSVYVVAVDRSSGGLGVPPRIRDSALVLVRLAPAGAVPTPVKVRITLPVR